MNFHHIGIATKNLEDTTVFIKNNFEVLEVSEKIYDKNQDAWLVMIKTKDLDIELVSGNVVEKLLKLKTTYYHVCYEVKDIHQAIHSFKGAILVSPPKEAILFNNRLVAFLFTPIGLVELLNEN